MLGIGTPSVPFRFFRGVVFSYQPDIFGKDFSKTRSSERREEARPPRPTTCEIQVVRDISVDILWFIVV